MNGACLPTYSRTGADNEALEKKMRNVQERVNMFFFFFKKPRLRGNTYFLAKVVRISTEGHTGKYLGNQSCFIMIQSFLGAVLF